VVEPAERPDDHEIVVAHGVREGGDLRGSRVQRRDEIVDVQPAATQRVRERKPKVRGGLGGRQVDRHGRHDRDACARPGTQRDHARSVPDQRDRALGDLARQLAVGARVDHVERRLTVSGPEPAPQVHDPTQGICQRVGAEPAVHRRPDERVEGQVLGRRGVEHQQQVHARARGAHHRRVDPVAGPGAGHVERIAHRDAREPQPVAE
jgi:hypothetical protein